MYNYSMKTISTTEARKNIKKLINYVRETNDTVVIGRRNAMEALLMKFPDAYSNSFDDITNINTYSGSFDFLKDEPDLYNISDLKERYV